MERDKPYKDLFLDNLPNEEWIDVVGYEGYYKVSNLGRVKTDRSEYSNQFCKFKLSPRILKQSVGLRKYPSIALCINNTPQTFQVHRLVAEAFIPNPENKRTVNHIDGDRTNNIVTNLEWNTYSENHKHAYNVLKRRHSMAGKHGSDNPTSKKVCQISKSGELLKIWDSCADACMALGIGKGNMWLACNNETRTANGFKWVYFNEYWQQVKSEIEKL